ncbi:glycoside hydrolase family 92 protein [Rhodofomes roseus]|uniref:Glycoside hydrolase family 92 protein n=1 Tax=Rhodofomes roseus TaxID=34475 RepID=A0ABQ8KBT5_9APHY|nr:glycoside hydrolase family 92 protein [Rhodofomes roseus]KAH9835013.1 glycoside hydrolase family 92 protein [Rhodofomes roseus]
MRTWMASRPWATFVVLSALCTHGSLAQIEDPASLVNMFIGTTNGGHVFPGATLPHGMVKVGMDTDSPGNQAGYDADPTYNAWGFSQLHDQGTGGGVSLSNFKIWPYASCPNGDSFAACPTAEENRKVLRATLPDGSPDDVASPGYFASNLSTGIRVELTATRRAALHRYTFPEGTVNPRILVDITNDGQQSNTNPIMTLNSTTARVVGGADFQASFGPQRYRVYTCVDFKGDGYDLSEPREYGAWINNNAVNQSVDIEQMYFGFRNELGALLTFNPNPNGTTTILVRAGVSFVSVDQACANAEEEIRTYDFDVIQAAARAEWNELLGRIQVDPTGVDNDTVSLFYSSLYRIHVVPADYTGENPLWNSTEPYYDSFYCNWDTFRALYSLLSLHDPLNFARIVRGMINIQQHEGWLPECRGSLTQLYVQGGSNGDPILGEFMVKYYEQATELNVSSTDLYSALLADAEVQPPNWNLVGRQVNIWKSLGYIPSDVWEPSGTNTKQVSRTIEYAFNDFAISQVARIIGNTADASKYAQRAGNFVNVWNPNVTVPGRDDIVGMMQPRFLNGTWNYTDPRHCSPNDPTQSTCYLTPTNVDGFYESSPLVYVPQDGAKLVELQGGVDAFISRLNFLIDDNYFDATDEPSMQIPFMYNYANAPGMTTVRAREVITDHFNLSVSGIPGNDGAMGTWASFLLLGLYPVPATRQYLLSSPWFPKVSFYNPVFNSTTTIIANGFEGNPTNGTGQIFVQNVTINGEIWNSTCYLDWSAFEAGATIELQLTDDANVTCGDGPQALPPSLSTGGFD